MKLNTLFLSTALVTISIFSLPGSASAQSINERLQNQHKRIEQGERTGRLSEKQEHRLNHRDEIIRHREQWDRRHHDGKLTKGERESLNKSLKRSSRAIYRDKHN